MGRAETIAKAICHDLIESVESWRGDFYLVSSIRYWDGDSVVVHIDKDRFTDRGTTEFKLATHGVRMSHEREKIVAAICEQHGLVRDCGEFQRSIDNPRKPGNAFREYCHALARITDTALYVRRREHPELRHNIDALLTLRVAPHRGIDRGWCYLDRDPERAFPVDYHVNTKGIPRHVFHVGSKLKCDRVSAVCNFLKVEGIDIPTLAVLRDDIDLGQRFLDRLQLSTTKIIVGFDRNQEAIVDFALATD